MIVDISTELRDYTYITSVYKCISNYNLKGHQIGRKIGDMLEILTMGAVYQNADLVSRLSTEEKLEGYTTAGHKVEFGFFHNENNQRALFGAIECKCVGVEETTSGKGARSQRKLEPTESFNLDFNGRWQSNPVTFNLTLDSIDSDDSVTVTVDATSNPPLNASYNMQLNDNIKVVLDENSHCLTTSPNGNMLEEIPGIIRTLKTIRLINIDRAHNTVTFQLFDCLTGPQTIEKAKQASLVAMDLRKKVDGYWGKEEIPAGKKHMTFVHVICEYSHWEEKSRNVIRTCIDHNVIVPDVIINKAFELFEERFGLHDMLDYISKRQFLDNPDVKEAVDDILEYFENRVFYDVELNHYIKFNYANNQLVVQPIR